MLRPFLSRAVHSLIRPFIPERAHPFPEAALLINPGPSEQRRLQRDQGQVPIVAARKTALRILPHGFDLPEGST